MAQVRTARRRTAGHSPALAAGNVSRGSSDLLAAPRVAQLAPVLEQVRLAGLDLAVTDPDGVLSGDTVLPAAVDHAVYRVVRESLTNVLKHGGGRVEVRVAAADTLELAVRDDGVRPGGASRDPADVGEGTGLGLVSMRERVESLGGSFAAGATGVGGARPAVGPVAPDGGSGRSCRCRTAGGRARAVGPGDPGAPRMIRVLLADDHAAIRAGLRMLLATAGDIEVIGEAGDGAVAVANARALRPDVVLMDVRMPGTDGVTATRQIVEEGLAEVLVLTTFDLDEYVFGALRAGAAGFLLKTAEATALVDAVRHVAAGDGVVAPEVTRRLIAELAAPQEGNGAGGRSGPGDGAARGPDAAGARRAGGPRVRPVERGARRRAGDQRGHRQDPCVAGARQARRHVPGPGGDRPRRGSRVALGPLRFGPAPGPWSRDHRSACVRPLTSPPGASSMGAFPQVHTRKASSCRELRAPWPA